MNSPTKIPLWQIFINLGLFFLIPSAINYTNNFTLNTTISTTFVIHTISLILIILNFKTLETHIHRFSANLKDGVYFSVIALVILLIINFVNVRWIQAPIWIPEREVLNSYLLFSPIIILAYTFTYATLFLIVFKSLTDRLKISGNEKIIIALSGISFAIFASVTYLPVTGAALIPNITYIFLISTCTSYIYNQTNTFVPMLIAYGTFLTIICLF